MVKAKVGVKKWWELSEIEKAVPGTVAKLTAFWAAKHPPVTASPPRQPKPGKPPKKDQKPVSVVQPADAGSSPTPGKDQG